MQYKLLLFGLLSAIAATVVIGINALNINQQTIISFEKGEKHFKDIATAATEVSSYAKRAEGHLILYLVLHRTEDKKKFPKRIASLYEQISILDQKIKNPDARIIFKKITAHTGNILPTGNALISYHDAAIGEKGTFIIENHRDTVFQLHKDFSAIREFGVKLTEFEVKLESDLKTDVKENAGRLRFYLLFLIALTSSLATFLGYILYRMIKTLNKEIAQRVQSENEVIQESKKLKNALATVKELSGLLPICSACKKIRDDKGYWNQIENYIRDHSKAEFSHSICPECMEKLYPDLLMKK